MTELVHTSKPRDGLRQRKLARVAFETLAISRIREKEPKCEHRKPDGGHHYAFLWKTHHLR